MKTVITYELPDGGVAVIYPASDDLTIEEIAAKDVPPGVSFSVVEAESLPDRYFRAAWKSNNTGVTVDVEKAKEVQRNVWRKLRAPRLAQLDTQVIRTVERSDARRRNELAAMKQALRDVTTIELPDDLESIRNTIPEILLP